MLKIKIIINQAYVPNRQEWKVNEKDANEHTRAINRQNRNKAVGTEGVAAWASTPANISGALIYDLLDSLIDEVLEDPSESIEIFNLVSLCEIHILFFGCQNGLAQLHPGSIFSAFTQGEGGLAILKPRPFDS